MIQNSYFPTIWWPLLIGQHTRNGGPFSHFFTIEQAWSIFNGKMGNLTKLKHMNSVYVHHAAQHTLCSGSAYSKRAPGLHPGGKPPTQSRGTGWVQAEQRTKLEKLNWWWIAHTKGMSKVSSIHPSTTHRNRIVQFEFNYEICPL